MKQKQHQLQGCVRRLFQLFPVLECKQNNSFVGFISHTLNSLFQFRNLNTLNEYNTFCLKAKYYQSSDHLPLITVSLGECVHLTYLCCAVNVLNRENRSQTIQEDLCQRRYELCGGHQHIYAVTPVGRRDSRPVR